MNTEAGWYPDAVRVGAERYWDGDSWTEESRWPGTHPFTSAVPNDLPAPGVTVETRPLPPRPRMTGQPHESTFGFWLPPTDWLNPTAEAAPPRRRRFRFAAKTASLVVAAILVAGGSFLIFGRHSDAADAAVTDAVHNTLVSHSADVIVTGSVEDGGSAGTFTGSGGINFDEDAMQIAATGPDGATEQVVYLDRVIYLNIGNEIGELLPGKSWISLDLSQLSSGGATSSLGSGDSLGNNPTAALQVLSQNGNTVTDLGSSALNGAPVEGYSVHVNAASIENELAQGSLPSWLKDVAKAITNPDVTYKVYIDGSGRLARMSTDVTETVSGRALTDVMTMDFSNYGTAVNVTAPPAGSVASFEDFLHAAESLASTHTD